MLRFDVNVHVFVCGDVGVLDSDSNGLDVLLVVEFPQAFFDCVLLGGYPVDEARGCCGAR